MNSREDPMFNLLSSVGGIDSSRFQKSQSMKDQRVGQPVPSDKSLAGASNKKLNTERAEKNGDTFQNLHSSTSRGSKPPAAQAGPKPAGMAAQGNTNRQLDALLEGSLPNKSNRYLSHALKPLVASLKVGHVAECPRVQDLCLLSRNS